jgi:nitrogen-specific signal transduction histidine kinase
MIPNPFHHLAVSGPDIRLSNNDFRILLDEIKTPALLVNLSKNIIVASNYAFTDLTGYGMDEITSSAIDKLIRKSRSIRSRMGRYNRAIYPVKIGTRCRLRSPNDS